MFHSHNESTLKINPLSNNIKIDYIPSPVKEVADYFASHEQAKDIVKIKLPLAEHLGYTFRGIITCVSIIKAALGIRAWFIITPQQLRRYLLRIGGISLKD